MRTRDKIIMTSLELFNEQGERNVTTNHIAAHMGISPGNLYYHFKNKNEIIFDIYLQYEGLVDTYLRMPQGRALEINDKVNYLTAVFEGLWAFRFLHRDLQHLLQSDERLHRRYNAFFQRCLSRTQDIYFGLNQAGIIKASDDEIKALALNTWIVVTSWFSFLHTNLLVDDTRKESKELLKSGIYQIFSLERPYLTAPYQDEVAHLAAQFGPSIGQLIELGMSEPSALSE
jgi:AcrR family transcriptional regulator